jgi:trehalose 6-phosphate synthase
MGTSLQPNVQRALETGNPSSFPALAPFMRGNTGVLGLALYDAHGTLLACSGPQEVLKALPYGVVQKSIQKGAVVNAFGHNADSQWLEEAQPIHNGDGLEGTMVIVADAGYIRNEGIAVWQRSFLRILALVVLIVVVTLAMVSWFLLRPMVKVVDRMRRLRLLSGQSDASGEPGGAKLKVSDLNLFSPLVHEVESMAESLIAARSAAATEARLRDAGEHQWTAERLAVHMRDRSGSSRIFVVSNREPYVHVHQGRETLCIVPPSGLVTAIEPILRACDGVWVASGSGNADAETVDDFDRLRVPPDDPRYTLRRVWLSAEEESQYYDGFANEGLWPLCHIAHTRPIFRTADWECYRRVNERFASALLEEMEGSENPVVFVQDYHFALLPRLVKAARPDARVAIFWHIPWPNPEAFGICPWQAELLDGLLGADLMGFHIPLHCNNFLSTVDRVLEARTDREHMTVLRNGHQSTVLPYPVSVAFEGPLREADAGDGALADEKEEIAFARTKLLREYGVKAESMVLGVDRMDYTKGIVERLLAIEQLLEEHPWHRERMTMVQIAAPSRTRISSYANLGRQVEETVERINLRYQTAHWKPIVLINRQCSHEEVARWYKAADVCLVTSLHDGMNLVAKEYVAARQDEIGVLVLSKFTGAAVELHDALIVNPYDIAGVAEAIHEGLEMPRGEQRRRMRRMRRQVMEHNIYRWAASVLGDLRELRLEGGKGADIHRAAPMSVRSPAVAVEKTA